MSALSFAVFEIIFASTWGNFQCAEVRPNLILEPLKDWLIALQPKVL